MSACSAFAAEIRQPLADSRTIRLAAVRALLGELVTYPKPGLVSLVDRGSHADMDATTFVRSTLALRRYFGEAAALGASGSGFAALRRIGIAAEARMRVATGGVNTHRGAIFHLGLLAAAAAQRQAGADRPTLGALVVRTWGAALAAHRGAADSHGRRTTLAFGVGGARAEAAAGFPTVYAVALPAYREALHRGGSPNQARVQAFFALLARLGDTNLLHRGGREGLAFAQQQAQGFLHRGGVHQTAWQRDAVAIHQAFVARRLSPGGSADLLAACLFIDAVER